MIENLKIALRRQKKLIVIFLLTIFLPSVSLSIFGIRAIRSERFRQVKQIENEHRRAAEFLKTQLKNRLKDIEVTLQNLAQYPAFSEKDYPAISETIRDRLTYSDLIEQAFLFLKGGKPLFPLFQPITKAKKLPSLTHLTTSQRAKLKRAEGFEFKEKKYKNAISLYKQLFSTAKDDNFQAQILNNIARCFTKLKNYDKAVKNYKKIYDEYPEGLSSSGLPLALIAKLRMIECYQDLHDPKNSLKNSLNLYGDILQKSWNLSEDQFKTYSSMVEETITQTLSKGSEDVALEEYKKEFTQLKSRHMEKIQQWQVVNKLKKDVIPELRQKLASSGPNKSYPIHHATTVDERTFLILAVMIPDKAREIPLGIIGIKIKNEYLKDDILSKFIEDIQSRENTNIAITDLSGKILLGEKNPSKELSTVTEFFEDNFPPWRIELFRSKTESLGIIDLRKSFYFWTIITLVIILSFGAVLIFRTVAHEMEILKIKSDFVSSVSHEFKTPLTSIKALIERLQEGKVKDSTKMIKYFSLISQDADKLTRLVRNILDFSKIEEGKKEYEFVETDVARLVDKQIEAFQKDVIQKKGKIHTQIEKEIPLIHADKDALSQALNNLLDNAVKFSPEGKDIDVRVKKDAQNIIIEIRDKGIGIPQDEVGRIFDKFYQGKNALRQSVKGTGLGLTLVTHIIDAHGGRISVKSKPGKGSAFSLILPIEGKSKRYSNA